MSESLLPMAEVRKRVGLSPSMIYRRGHLLAKRRELMQAWADYLAG